MLFKTIVFSFLTIVVGSAFAAPVPVHATGGVLAVRDHSSSDLNTRSLEKRSFIDNVSGGIFERELGDDSAELYIRDVEEDIAKRGLGVSSLFHFKTLVCLHTSSVMQCVHVILTRPIERCQQSKGRVSQRTTIRKSKETVGSYSKIHQSYK